MHRQKERYQRLMALLVLGVVLFTPPLLLVFNRPVRVLGLPLLLLYLFLAWGALVALAAVAARRMDWGTAERPPRARVLTDAPGDAAGEGPDA